ncbi:MAG: hypothetical protein ACHQFX_06945 [Chitinophagales bacterium]
MTKKIIASIAFFLSLHVAAQVTVSVQLPPAGMIQKDQLWNLVLMNNSSEMLTTTVSLNLQDAVTGQTVLSGGSRMFTLGKGMKLLTMRELQPVQYNYLAAELTGSYVPLGSYVACYRIIRVEPKGPEPLADECIRVNISPLSPPLLNTPADMSVVEAKYPQFTWLPPSPAEMFSNLNYDITVTEVLKGQSAAEAILNNVPVYANANLRNPFENYPSSYSSLEAGKLYAWQVTARNGLNYSAQTEVWSFSLPEKDSLKITATGTTYISLNDNDKSVGVNFIRDKNLFVKYYSFYKEHDVSVRILSNEGKVIQEIRQKIVYGDNFLLFSLNKSFEEDKVYTLEFNDLQQPKRSIQFSIKQPNKSN